MMKWAVQLRRVFLKECVKFFLLAKQYALISLATSLTAEEMESFRQSDCLMLKLSSRLKGSMTVSCLGQSHHWLQLECLISWFSLAESHSFKHSQSLAMSSVDSAGMILTR